MNKVTLDYKDSLTMSAVVGGTAARIYKLEEERPYNSYNARGDFVGEQRGGERTGPKGQQYRAKCDMKAQSLNKQINDMKGRAVSTNERLGMTFSRRLGKMRDEDQTEDLAATHGQMNERYHLYEMEREMKYQKNTVMPQRAPLSKEDAYSRALKKYARGV